MDIQSGLSILIAMPAHGTTALDTAGMSTTAVTGIRDGFDVAAAMAERRVRPKHEGHTELHAMD